MPGAACARASWRAPGRSRAAACNTREDEAVAVAQLRARRCDIAMRRHVGLAAWAAHDVAGVEHRRPAEDEVHIAADQAVAEAAYARRAKERVLIASD